MSNSTGISLDGSWDHRRNGKFHIVDAFDTMQGKIIDYEVIQRKVSENSDKSFPDLQTKWRLRESKKLSQD